MEKHELQKVKNNSIKALTEQGLLITFNVLYKENQEKKREFEGFYKKNRDQINNLVILGLENYEIKEWEEFSEELYSKYEELKGLNELPERYWGAEDIEIRNEIHEWVEFYDNEADEEYEEYEELYGNIFVKVEGNENDYIISFKRDANLADISELEEMIDELMEEKKDQ